MSKSPRQEASEKSSSTDKEVLINTATYAFRTTNENGESSYHLINPAGNKTYGGMYSAWGTSMRNGITDVDWFDLSKRNVNGKLCGKCVRATPFERTHNRQNGNAKQIGVSVDDYDALLQWLKEKRELYITAMESNIPIENFNFNR